jgi:hypothetical protein
VARLLAKGNGVVMDKLKNELRFLLGDLVILFQRYEYAFKSLLILSVIEGSAESLKHNFNNRIDKVSKKSLGQLVGLYLAEVVEPNKPLEPGLPENDYLHLSMRFSLEMVCLAKSEIEAKYKSFVDDRNFVIHNLISDLVPEDESSYKNMIEKLTDINKKFEKDLHSLNQTKKIMIDSYKRILNSDELDALLTPATH